MQKEQLENQWNQLKGQIKQKWNRLTDKDLDQCNGKHDALCNCIQKAYGCKKEQAEQQIRDFKPEQTSSKQGSNIAANQGQQRPDQRGQHGQHGGQHGNQPSSKEKGGHEQREKARM